MRVDRAVHPPSDGNTRNRYPSAGVPIVAQSRYHACQRRTVIPMMCSHIRTCLALGLGLLLSLALSACGGPQADLQLAPVGLLRPDIQNQYDFIREPYQLALANPA